MRMEPRRLPACVRPPLGRRDRLQGTTVSDDDGKRTAGHTTSTCAGALDRPAGIARAVFKRVPPEELGRGWSAFGGWVAQAVRRDISAVGRSAPPTTKDLRALAGREPAPAQTERRGRGYERDVLDALLEEGRLAVRCSKVKDGGGRPRVGDEGSAVTLDLAKPAVQTDGPRCC